MKINELKELKAKNPKELQYLLKENQEKLRELRFSVNANQLKNIKELNKARKMVARILTIIKEKYEKQ